MKVLFTGFFPIWQCHIVGECNFIQEHLNAGDDVDLLTCEASLKACDANPKLQLINCLTCMGIREDAVSLLSRKIGKMPLISESAKAKALKVNIPNFQSIAELKQFTCFNASVGSDVVSSVMTALGDHEFDPILYADHIKKTILDYLGSYLTAMEYLDQKKYSLVYIFNGRFASAKAFIRACEKNGTDYFTLERLGMPDRVLKIKNGTVHGFSSYATWINKFWSEHQNNLEVIKEAKDFFEERPKGLMTGWHSFIREQEKACLPRGWNSQKRNMAIFSSTETEFAGIPEVFNGALYSNQKSCYLRVAELLQEKNPMIHLHLRIHPNSKSEKRRWWEDYEFKECSNLTVIPPESPVSSYELLRACEKTIVFMTTMGAEATYWGKPSILLSNSMYKGIGAVYEPVSEEEAIQLILDQDLKAKPRGATLAYGGFLRMGFPKLTDSEALDNCTLTFKGKRPNASPQILKAYWRWHSVVKPSRFPSFLKSLWQKFEWLRLRKDLD